MVQRVTDAATDLTPAAFGAFFYNVVDTAGESFMLYTLSGVPAEAFAPFPMPRNTRVFGPTFAGEATVRLDDVTADPRYGHNLPFRGLPEGHPPVRSYLAVPVRSVRGEVLGGLFFGHPESGRFTETDERLVEGIAAHAAVAIDNARLYEAQRQSRELAERAQARLAVLADASRVLASSLDVDRILEGLTGIVAPTLADRCMVYLAGDDGLIRQVVAASDQPGRRGRPCRICRSPPGIRPVRSPAVSPRERASCSPPQPMRPMRGPAPPRGSSCPWSGAKGRWVCWPSPWRPVPPTDGLVEDRTMPLDSGLDRLRDSLLTAPDDVDAMCEHLTVDARTARTAHDDVAVLVVRWLALGTTIDLQVPSEARALRPLRAALRRWLAAGGVTDHEAFEILVATTEACSNAIRHGAPQATHFELKAELNGDVAIRVRSSGRWRERRSSAPGGRGLDIMRQFMDDTEVDGGPDATEVRMRRRLENGIPAGVAEPGPGLDAM